MLFDLFALGGFAVSLKFFSDENPIFKFINLNKGFFFLPLKNVKNPNPKN
jgi:hypothetical protein